MPLNFSTDDGAEVEITPGSDLPTEVQAAKEAFDRAQANDPVSDDARKPPKRADKTDPGYTPNPEPKRRGRPRKDDPDASRVTKQTKEQVKKEPLKPKDYRPGLTMVTDALWVGASVTPVIGPIAGPYAAVVKLNQSGIVEMVNAAANNNATARKYVEKIIGDGEGQGAAWVLPFIPVVVNIGQQIAQVATNAEFRDAVVQANAQMLQDYQKQMIEMLQAAAPQEA